MPDTLCKHWPRTMTKHRLSFKISGLAFRVYCTALYRSLHVLPRVGLHDGAPRLLPVAVFWVSEGVVADIGFGVLVRVGAAVVVVVCVVVLVVVVCVVVVVKCCVLCVFRLLLFVLLMMMRVRLSMLISLLLVLVLVPSVSCCGVTLHMHDLLCSDCRLC